MKDEKKYVHTIEISRPTGPRVIPPVAGESRGYLAVIAPKVVSRVKSSTMAVASVLRRPKAIAVGSSLALALFAHLAIASMTHGFTGLMTQASILLTGAGVNPTVSASYTGPGDTVSFAAWGGVRCYKASYTGNVADIWDAATGSTTQTLLTCSAGGILNETVNSLATTCASGCRVKTLYDQTGNTQCTTACDWTQATNANRPSFLPNTQNGRGVIRFAAGSQVLASASMTLINQPFTISAVGGKRTAGTTSYSSFLANPASGLLFANSANNYTVFAGSVPNAAATDAAYHSVQAVFNGSSSSTIIDVTTTSSMVAGGAGFTGVASIGFYSISLTGDIFEVGISSGAMSAPNQTTIGANQHGTSGYNF